MWVDSYLEFSDAQALTATAASTNVVDLSVARDIAKGQTLWAVLTVDVAVAGTSPTIDVTVETDDNAAFSSAATVGTVFPQITNVNGTAGAKFVQALPQGAYERFIRFQYTLGGTTPTGTVSLHVTDQEPESWQAYPDATN